MPGSREPGRDKPGRAERARKDQSPRKGGHGNPDARRTEPVRREPFSGGVPGLRAVPLFPRPGEELVRALEDYRQVLDRVHPLKGRHHSGLPDDVKRLSLSLTAERGPGPQANYLSVPANLSAYLYYFLPWNLYRFSRLLSGLDFDLPDGASVLDLGSGPMTLVQALWLSRPRLRGKRLRFVCVDQTGQALRAGKSLFEALSGEAGRSWTVEAVQAPAHKAPMEPFDVVASANAMNELARGRGEQGHENLERLASLVAGRLAGNGRLFLVEPGNRLGGKLMSRLRDALREDFGLKPLAPCTHDEDCPMLDPRWRSWCHCVFPADEAPRWLATLTRLAGLDKHRLSVSFMYMASKAAYGDRLRRIVSHRFPVEDGQGLYSCGHEGLRLLTFRRPVPGLASGALLDAELPEPTVRDPKSGVWLTALDPGPDTDADQRARKDAAGRREPATGEGPDRGQDRGLDKGSDKRPDTSSGSEAGQGSGERSWKASGKEPGQGSGERSGKASGKAYGKGPAKGPGAKPGRGRP